MNKQIIEEFARLVDHINYELNNAVVNKEKVKHMFRLRQIKNAYKIIKGYKKVITKGDDLKNIKGIGKRIIARIDEILKKGKLSEITSDEDKRKINKLVDELEQVIGIGKKTAIDLAKNKNIKSVKDLKKKVNSGEINVNDEIKLGLKYHKKYSTEIPRNEMKKHNKLLEKMIKNIDNNLVKKVCGSYRRGKPISHDIDVLIVHPDVKNRVTKENTMLPTIIQELKAVGYLVDDMTYKNYVTKYMGFCKIPSLPVRRIDIRFFPYASYYPALLYFTGSGELNKKMRVVAKKKGFKLNEYGLFKILPNDKYKRIKIKSEKDIFDYLDMEFVEPRDR